MSICFERIKLCWSFRTKGEQKNNWKYPITLGGSNIDINFVTNTTRSLAFDVCDSKLDKISRPLVTKLQY